MSENRSHSPNAWEANDPQFSRQQGRPKPAPPQKSSRVLEAVAWCLLALAVLHGILTYLNLPAEIPVHFGIDGQPDAWGPKKEYVVGPITLVPCTVMCIVVARFPRVHNFPWDMHTDQAWQQFYTFSRNMLLWMAIGMGCILTNLTFSTAHPEKTAVGNILWPLLIIFLPMIYYLVKMVRLARKPHLRDS